MPNDLFKKLAAQESNFKDSQFLSPVVRGNKIRVRIAGIVMSLTVVEPKGFSGWGVFGPLDYTTARMVREPSLAERSAYLKLFPVVRLVVSHRKKRRWFGFPAQHSDQRFGFADAVPIDLPTDVEAFDTVITRFDGQHCWFEQHDPRRSRRIGKGLREHLRDLVDLKSVEVEGCNQVERDVYELALLRKLQHQKDPDEVRIQRALMRGGATYQAHREVGNSFLVTYEVNGQLHSSTVDKASLAIQSAGICLDGFDANFDLQSLVGVIAEGQRTDQINRV